MLGTTHQTKYGQVIEWVLYFGLCGLSVYFTYGVIDKFFSGKTSFSQHDVPVNELPTIVLCFSNKYDSRNIDYEYGSDFKIEYEFYKNGLHSVFLKEGEYSTLMEEMLYLEKITTTIGNCFKITTVLNNIQPL